MNRLTENQRLSRRIGVKLLGLCLLVVLSGTTRAASDDFVDGTAAQALNPMAQHSASESPVLICGGKSAGRVASLLIRGTDVAALWRSAYRMLRPRTALADRAAPSQGAQNNANRFAHKSPTWGIDLAHGGALITVQTKW